MVGLILGTGGNGADLSVVTAVASDVAKDKVIVGPDGQPITGTLDAYDVTEITPKSTAQVINGPIIIPSSLKVKAVPATVGTGFARRSDSPLTHPYDILEPAGGYFSSVRLACLCYTAITPSLVDTNTMRIYIPLEIKEYNIVNITIRTTAESYPSSSSYRMICAWCPTPLNGANADDSGLVPNMTLNTLYAKGATSSPWGFSLRGIGISSIMPGGEGQNFYTVDFINLDDNNKFRGAYLANIWYYPTIS